MTTVATILGNAWAVICLLIPAWIFTIAALDRIARLTAPRRQQRRDVETVRGLGARLGERDDLMALADVSIEACDVALWEIECSVGEEA